MAKNTNFKLSHVLFFLFFILIIIACTVGYFLIIILPSFLLILGFIKNLFKISTLLGIKVVEDFDLNHSGKKRLSELQKSKDQLKNIFSDIENQGSSISKRKDGMYSEKSNLGKKLNKQLIEIGPELTKTTKEYQMLKGLPEKRKNHYLNIKSSFIAYIISIPIFLILLIFFTSESIIFLELIFHYITVLPKTISTFGIDLFILNLPSLNGVEKIYEFYPNYHAPLFLSSSIAGIIYFFSKNISFSIKKNELHNRDNHIIKNSAIEDNTKSEIKNEQEQTIDDFYNISKMNFPAASSGVSIQDTINLNVASDGVLNPSFAIKNGGEIEGNKRNQTETFEISQKSKGILIFLIFIFGGIGFHRFYVGKWITGLLYLFTGGFLYFGVIIDLILILKNKFRDAQGRLVVSVNKKKTLGEEKARRNIMLKMLFSFKGRINRKPYWMMMLVVLIGVIVTSVINLVTTGEDSGIASTLFFLIIVWPSLAIQVKRWHDRDKSGWWVLISIIPIVGTIWTIIANGFLTGTESSNRFGENPLKQNKKVISEAQNKNKLPKTKEVEIKNGGEIEGNKRNQTEKNRINTTEEELEGFRIVKKIVGGEIIDSERIFHRDTKSYMGVILDDNNRKPICRLWFNSSKKYIGIMDKNKKEKKELLYSLNDIYKYTDRLKDAAKLYV
jgi:uncharacterized membrane protein YhaH (DUF805 family)